MSMRRESMINSLRGTMESLKSESSCTKVQQLPTSPNDQSSICESNKISDMDQQKNLTPPSLNFPEVEFELDEDVEVQTPNSSTWETFFSDYLDSDFMILSPVRNLPSPQTSSYKYTNYVNAMQGQSLSGFSPPRYLSQIRSLSSNHKGKGLSPLHKVFNSPNNQYMHVDQRLSLPDGIEHDQFLEHHGYQIDHNYTGGYQTRFFDNPNSAPEMLDCLATQDASTFCGSVSEETSSGGSRMMQEKDIVYNRMESMGTAPLSLHLQHESNKEQQQHEQRQQMPTFNHEMMVPPYIGTSEQEEDSGLQLVHLLLACAEAVSKEDYMLARRYLYQLNRIVTPLGDSMQRVASCFTEALTSRLAATLTTSSTTKAKPFSPFPPNSMEIHKIYQIIYQACPYIKFAHFTANQAIFEAFEAEERVHVIDLDILQGYQWPALMQALASRHSGAPFLRITGVGSSIKSLKETGRCLTELAHSLHIPFEFHPIAEELEDLKPHMFNRRVGEALAVNSVNRLHHVPGNHLGSLLAMIRDQAPNIVTIIEQEASHNGPHFLSRFLEALHYYSALFDSLDATFPPDSSERAKVEQYILAPEIRNIVACEGAERTERHEKLEKWRKIMQGKGFKGVALSANAVTQSKILLGLYSCDAYTLKEDNGCLLLGWQDRTLLAASAWRC